MFNSYKAIIFDCDGVIVDTENLANDIMKTMLAKQGLFLDEQTMHEKFSGYTSEHGIKAASQMLGKPLPTSFLEEYRTAFQTKIDEQLEPIDGVLSLLEKIKIPIAMATNANRQEMHFKLKKIGLDERFSTRFCVEDVAQGKPAPDLYLKAAAALKTKPQDCLVIEDSIAGIKAGVAAGMTVLAYSDTMDPAKQTAAGAAVCFQSMEKLATLINLN
ncbi:HAD family hydrolase [Marinomonas transparens]|uniref:HAD family phosphatase n=1 Tax=Marinomonas transparens TaxID=2795388 RepID=A0A934JP93_9GAMM|nr:HAD family phosphatase [Marinomonas transparens]MBJ7537599.1 HAD family phosphatase [Marinomonas transparens]